MIFADIVSYVFDRSGQKPNDFLRKFLAVYVKILSLVFNPSEINTIDIVG